MPPRGCRIECFQPCSCPVEPLALETPGLPVWVVRAAVVKWCFHNTIVIQSIVRGSAGLHVLSLLLPHLLVEHGDFLSVFEIMTSHSNFAVGNKQTRLYVITYMVVRNRIAGQNLESLPIIHKYEL